MDAITLLRNDHDQVKGILDRIERAEPDDPARGELFTRLREEMGAHETIEEEIFYPALRDAAREQVAEAYEEHNLVDWVLEGMADLPSDDEAFTAKLAVAKENILHHIEEEEEGLFARARSLLGEDALAELGERMAERKQALI